MSKIGKKQLNISPEIINLIKIKKFSYSWRTPLSKEKVNDIILHKLIISGPLGTQSIFISNLFNVEILTDSLKIYPSNNNLSQNLKRKRDQLWGTLWTQINKMIQGVTVGFKRYIKLTGIGYKANLIELPNNPQKTIIIFNIGFSHPVNIEVPSNIKILNVTNTSQGSIIELTGSSLIDLNNFIFSIKRLRPADKSFKGSGISVINPELSIS